MLFHYLCSASDVKLIHSHRCSRLQTQNQINLELALREQKAYSPPAEKHAPCVSLNRSQALTERAVNAQTVYFEIPFGVINVI